MVARPDGLAALVEDHEVARLLRKRLHVVRKPDELRRKRRLPVRRLERAAHAVGKRVLLSGVHLAVAAVALELSAPEPAEREIARAGLRIGEAARVYRVASPDRLRLGDERTLRTLRHGDADAEQTSPVARGEVHVVASVLLRNVAVPQLARRPRNILEAKHHAVVHYLAGHRVELPVRAREYLVRMVVHHVEVVSVVALGDARVAVVARIDEEPPAEDVRGGVRGIVAGNEIAGFCHFPLLLFSSDCICTSTRFDIG